MKKRPLPKHETPTKKGDCAKCGFEFPMSDLHISRFEGKAALLCHRCLSEKNEEKKPE